ncbi:hypothetical protein PRIPAC_75168 [Pristionchus pacificus]|uniref:Uncharacterized protein n=1 Tax=Pristionchus pacificus TaxID=54126 RepID=A0A2A6C768_PRIPA|nr:hypothetical protein PRIPAC_75168 [Pristionchus pacificus]|eukprot:PDM73946.1 hypothetical protein PRIPAC_41302 [Pristionchus pacificus]
MILLNPHHSTRPSLRWQRAQAGLARAPSQHEVNSVRGDEGLLKDDGNDHRRADDLGQCPLSLSVLVNDLIDRDLDGIGGTFETSNYIEHSVDRTRHAYISQSCAACVSMYAVKKRRSSIIEFAIQLENFRGARAESGNDVADYQLIINTVEIRKEIQNRNPSAPHTSCGSADALQSREADMDVKLKFEL